MHSGEVQSGSGCHLLAGRKFVNQKLAQQLRKFKIIKKYILMRWFLHPACYKSDIWKMRDHAIG